MRRGKVYHAEEPAWGQGAGIGHCGAVSNHSLKCVQGLAWIVGVCVGWDWKRLRTDLTCPVTLIRSHHLKMVETRSEGQIRHGNKDGNRFEIHHATRKCSRQTALVHQDFGASCSSRTFSSINYLDLFWLLMRRNVPLFCSNSSISFLLLVLFQHV